MKPMSSEAVKRLALANGAKLSLGGKAVNAARLQVVTGAKPEKTPAYMPPEPKVEAPQTIEAKPDPVVREALTSIDNYAASQFLLNDSNAQVMNSIKDTLQKVSTQETEKRPVAWVFKVKRDAQGLMETITATAKFKE